MSLSDLTPWLIRKIALQCSPREIEGLQQLSRRLLEILCPPHSWESYWKPMLDKHQMAVFIAGRFQYHEVWSWGAHDGTDPHLVCQYMQQNLAQRKPCGIRLAVARGIRWQYAQRRFRVIDWCDACQQERFVILGKNFSSYWTTPPICCSPECFASIYGINSSTWSRPPEGDVSVGVRTGPEPGVVRCWAVQSLGDEALGFKQPRRSNSQRRVRAAALAHTNVSGA